MTDQRNDALREANQNREDIKRQMERELRTEPDRTPDPVPIVADAIMRELRRQMQPGDSLYDRGHLRPLRDVLAELETVNLLEIARVAIEAMEKSK